MPAVNSGASEELIEHLQETLVENGGFDDLNEAVNFCMRYTAFNRHGEKFDY